MWKLIIAFCIALSATLYAEKKVLAFAGSTRDESINKKLVKEAASIAQKLHAKVTVIDLKDYPIAFYDQDLEMKEGMPLKAKELRKLMEENDLILIASPEYNGSLTAVLKNAIDWVSRNENGNSSRSAFQGKVFVIMSTSPGSNGGARGLMQLRLIIENIGGIVYPEQIVVPDGFNAFDEKGHLKNEAIKEEIKRILYSAMDEKA